MKALTICQPYASLIMDGRKRIENRQWAPSFRGTLIIHAGLSRRWLNTWDVETEGPLPDPMPFGAVVGCADVTAIYSMQAVRKDPGLLPKKHRWVPTHQHAEGRFLWILEHVYRLKKPIPWKGAQGLWNPSILIASPEWQAAEFERVTPQEG